ncbi:MAG: FecR domain-containing protein [Bdellovibrionaceae bacterium]|nr:FecR domain-containing protein [Pseudobdellovibrionaceae bacterium]
MLKSYKLTILSLVTSLIYLPCISFAGNVHGIFRVVKGNVQVKSSNGKLSKARLGQKVFPKDTIITDKDSRAKIVMIDDNIINVSPSSEIVFEKYEYEPGNDKKEVLIDVLYGKVRSKVNQKYDGAKNTFRVKTPSAVAGVRGTDFFTSFNKTNNTSSVVTFEGEVAYGLPGPNGSIRNAVAVKAGQMASNSVGKAPSQPRALNRVQLSNMDKSSDSEKSEPNNKRAPADDVNRPDGDDNNKGNKEDTPKEDGNDKSAAADSQNNEPDKNEADKKETVSNDKNEPEKKEPISNDKNQKEDKGPKGNQAAVAPDAAPKSGPNTARDPANVPVSMNPPPAAGIDSGRAPFNPSGTMLRNDDLVGGGTGGFFPESRSIIGTTIPDFNAINTDTSKGIITNINPCAGTCTDIIRDVIEGGNSRLLIRIINK